ncbi:MAG: HNH endonuclease, partial [Fusobacteriaceae bacterium]
TNFWIFLNNPKYWDLEKFLSDSKETSLPLTWTIPKFQKDYFYPNQYGVLRVGKDKRTLKELGSNKRLESGVYAIVQIISSAKEKNEEHAWDNIYNLNNESSYLRAQYCIELKIIHNLVDAPLFFKDISNIPQIENDKYLISGYQASSIPLSESCFNKLLKISNLDIVNSEKNDEYFILTGLEKEIISKYRVGQTNFRNNLLFHQSRCKICKLSNENFLIASHIKPWSVSNEFEKVDVHNGFLLCPHHDKLFDGGYISFKDNGEILISPSLNQADQLLMNVNSKFKIKLNNENLKYLKYHRENILKK